MKTTAIVILATAVIYAPVSILVFGNGWDTICDRAYFMLAGGMVPFLLEVK